MNAKDLKNSILELAVQGKLVEQREEEEPAVVLINRMRDKQARMLRNKEIKKEKFNKEVEYTGKLPLGWEYVKVGELTSVVTKQTGFDYSKTIKPNLVEAKLNNTIPLIQTKNFKGREFNFETDYYISLEIARRFPKIMLDSKCMLFSIVGASIGNVGIYDYHELAMIGGAICKVKFLSDEIYDYIFYFLQSPSGQKEIRKNYKSTAQGTITVQDVREIVIPMPPLEEQKRIVAKIEEIMPYVDKYDVAYSEAEELNKKFPEDMRKSILQYAIQGKLVEQREEDGTAEELYQQIQEEKKKLIEEGKIKKPKKLPKITEDDIPFDIPENWKWVRLNDIFNFIDYRGKTPTKISSGVVLITASNIRKGFLDFTKADFISEAEYIERQSRGITKKGDILFTTEAPLGNVAINTIEVSSCGQRAITFQQYGENIFSNELFCFFLQSPYFQFELVNNATGTTAKGIKAAKLKELLVPFPPLEEQKRIVEKIEELLPYTKQLVK